MRAWSRDGESSEDLDDDGSGFIGAGEFARFMKRGEDWLETTR